MTAWNSAATVSTEYGRRWWKDGFGQRLAALAWLATLGLAGCGVFPLFPEQAPSLRAGEGLKETKFRIEAKESTCDPSLIAIDRDGRALKVGITVASVGREHIFLIPDLNIRRTVAAGEESTIEFVADKSGIYEFGCSRFPALWMNPLEKRGKLAIK